MPVVAPRLSIEEFHRVCEALPERRLELLDGEILEMTPKGTRHAVITHALSAELGARVRTRGWTTRPELPVVLGDSEPEPDLAIVSGEPEDYWDAHPQPEQIQLLIEVADSSLDYDLGRKLDLYRQAGIGAYWVVDCQQLQRIEAIANPTLADLAEVVDGLLSRLRQRFGPQP